MEMHMGRKEQGATTATTHTLTRKENDVGQLSGHDHCLLLKYIDWSGFQIFNGTKELDFRS